MSGINCHFVSRFFTRPWEQAERQLSFYSFDRGVVDKAPSRHLFAELDANDAETEARLNTLVETPIAAARSALTAASPSGAIAVTDPELFRALMLLFPLQPTRPSGASNHSQLGEVLRLSDAELAAVVTEGASRFKAVRVRALDAAPMFYPERGFFVLPVPAQDGSFSAAPTIPLTPMHALSLVPADVDLGILSQHWRPGLVSNFSVDLRSPKVVLHPSVLSDDAASLGAAVEDARRDCVEHFRMCSDLNGVLAQIEAM